jgi:hypothetical protein
MNSMRMHIIYLAQTEVYFDDRLFVLRFAGFQMHSSDVVWAPGHFKLKACTRMCARK